jgi:hypothetical protein
VCAEVTAGTRGEGLLRPALEIRDLKQRKQSRARKPSVQGNGGSGHGLAAAGPFARLPLVPQPLKERQISLNYHIATKNNFFD